MKFFDWEMEHYRSREDSLLGSDERYTLRLGGASDGRSTHHWLLVVLCRHTSDTTLSDGMVYTNELDPYWEGEAVLFGQLVARVTQPDDVENAAVVAKEQLEDAMRPIAQGLLSMATPAKQARTTGALDKYAVLGCALCNETARCELHRRD